MKSTKTHTLSHTHKRLLRVLLSFLSADDDDGDGSRDVEETAFLPGDQMN